MLFYFSLFRKVAFPLRPAGRRGPRARGAGLWDTQNKQNIKKTMGFKAIGHNFGPFGGKDED